MIISRKIVIFAISGKLMAASLLDITHDALNFNADYLAIKAGSAAVKDEYSIAKSTWLPQVGLNFSKGLTETRPSPVGNDDKQSLKKLSYGISLNQKLFDLPSWLSIRKQSFLLQKAVFEELSAKQTLMFNVALQYFEVLQRIGEHYSEKSKLDALGEQKRQIEQEFKAGKSSKSELAQVEAQYLLSKSEELYAKNNVFHSIQKLSQLTGRKYRYLYLLSKDIPMKSPKPNKVDSWLKLMKKQNINLKASFAGLASARQALEVARASGSPVIGFSASLIRSRPLNFQNSDFGDIKDWGVSMSWPVITGGKNLALLSQGEHLLTKSEQSFIALERDLRQQTINTFYDINLGIERIKASRMAVASAKISLSAVEDGYKVGTQTIAEVLNSISQLNSANLQLIKSRYAYLGDVLRLKLLVGVLSEKDLLKLSALFAERKNLDLFY